MEEGFIHCGMRCLILKGTLDHILISVSGEEEDYFEIDLMKVTEGSWKNY